MTSTLRSPTPTRGRRHVMRSLFSPLTVIGAMLCSVVTMLTVAGCAVGGSNEPTHTANSTRPSTPKASTASSTSARSSSVGAESSSPSARDGGASSSGAEPRAAQAGPASGGTGAGVGSGALYEVVGVADGDTITVRIGGVKEKVRLIGLDTPETHKPDTPVQCFGKEAGSHMQSLVQGKSVQLQADSSQGDRDRYGRLLRHVFVGGSTNVALAQIEGGFGREYTYDGPYTYRLQYLAAMAQAKAAHRGTWGSPCNGFHVQSASATDGSTATSAPSVASTSPLPSAEVPKAPAVPSSSEAGCVIKGNINSRGEKIAHLPGSATYAKTRITPSTGERMFCSVADALAAGWRMAAD